VPPDQLAHPPVRASLVCQRSAFFRVVDGKPDSTPQPAAVLARNSAEQSRHPALTEDVDNSVRQPDTPVSVGLADIVQKRRPEDILVTTSASHQRVVNGQVVRTVEAGKPSQ